MLFRSIPYIPGCATISEVGFAQESGCDICKIFPGANVGGPSFIKNLKAPMPWSILMVTGGVEPNKENIENWIAAGADCLGMGSNLFPKNIIESKQWNLITEKCKDVISII